MEETIEDLKVDFNAVLASGGGSLSESQFMRDFKSLIGKNIPYRQLGHADLRSLLKSLGGYFFSVRSGETYISSTGDAKTAHIASLVSRTKTKKKPKARKSAFSYQKRSPFKPPPLYRPAEVRRPATYSPVVYKGVQRAPPPPRFGNPPIIPQRQPLLNAQNRLDPSKSPVPSTNVATSPSQNKKGSSINIPEAQNRILNDKSDSRVNGTSDSKVPALVVAPKDDAVFVDIQWLQAKVQQPKKLAPQSPELISPPILNNSQPPLKSVSGTTKSVKKEQQVIFKSNIEELASLATQLGLPAPSYSELKRKPTKKPVLYTAKVKIGKDLSFSSYPEERPTAEEALELAAKLACDDLRLRLSKLSKEDTKLTEANIIDRIREIVNVKPNGIFVEAVISCYEETHGTSIPASWLDAVKKSPKFSVEKIHDSRTIIYPVSVRPPSPTISDSGDAPAIVKFNGKVSSSANERLYKDINANTVTAADSKPRTLPGLTLPTTNTWDVYVTSVGTNDIWVRLIGDDYDAKYNDVMTELELKMLNHDEVVTHPQVDEYYCMKYDSCYIRVQLREIFSEGDCAVFFIDNGEVDTIPLADLRVLSDEYMTLPAQAVQCRLSYLNISYEASQTYLMNHVIGSSFVAEVVKMPSAHYNLANIILHNTADEKQGAININNCILDEIVKKMEPPTLTQRHVTCLKLTNIEPETSPHCQVQGQDLTFLEELLREIYDNQDLVQLYGLSAHPNMSTKCNQKQFLCKYKQSWRRGTISSTEDSRNPMVYFIDYGTKSNVAVHDMFDVEKVLPPLKSFPAQAIQVNLLDLPPSKLNVGIVHRLAELAPPNTTVISKCINVVGGIPEIELFKRVQPDNMIASINTDLTFNYEEYSKKTIEDLRVAPQNSPLKGSGCTDPLKKYQLPPVNEGFFDVFVSMSSNPYNFVVQPLTNRQAFDNMMAELQDLYTAQSAVMPIPAIEELVKDATFAAKHPEDQMWYRVSVILALGDSMVSVRYADYGDVGLVPIERVRFLDPKFRTIPSLAIRAKLHGIKPKENLADWSVMQCIHFNELVQDKSFVSKVMDVNSDSDVWQLSLQLIDTSDTNEDTDIGTLMVNARMADVE